MNNLNVEGFLKIIPDALVGWANVFAVILIVVVVIALLNKIFK